MSVDRVSLINYVTRIHFGFGAAAAVPAELERLSIRRPLVVTDHGIVESGILNIALPRVPVAAIFRDTPSNPTEAAALQGADLYRDAGCDGVVAIGGGSPMDLAKVIALLATHPAPLSSYALVNGGIERIANTVPSVIAVPTTAGTGSEIARAAVVIMSSGAKMVVASPYLIPRAAVCDPALTLGLPPYLTAATGFDAVAHCVETFCSPNTNPPADAIALDGLVRALTYLEIAVANGSDRAARWHMLMAALEGGMTFQKGLGAVHALSHPLGELGLHHGTLNAILLPHVLAFNAPHIGPKLGVMTEILGLPGRDGIIEYLAELIHRVGLPTQLSALGVTPGQLALTAEKAVRDSCNATNPVPLSYGDYQEILKRAIG